MKYKEELESAKIKLALSVNEALPKNYVVNIKVYEKMILAVAFFLWYKKQTENEVQIEFSNRALAPSVGDLHVEVFSIESHDEETKKAFCDTLALSDVFEISENENEGIDIGLTFHRLYVPYVPEK